MSEKDTIIRQRLIELERKHAKALRKLQRAEKSKQRRQTFHGFPVKDKNSDYSDVQNRSSTLLPQEVFTPDDRKSSSLSVHKKGLGKSVTFKDTLETNQLPPSNKRFHESCGNASFKEKSRRSLPLGSCSQETESETDIERLQCHIKTSTDKSNAAGKNWVTSSSDSIPVSDNEKILEVDVVKKEHKDCSGTQNDQDWTVNNAEIVGCSVNNAEIVGCSGLGNDVSIISACKEEHSDSTKEVSFASNKKELAAEEMEIPGIDSVVEDKHASDHNSEKVSTKKGLDESTVKAGGIVENEDVGRCSSRQENDNSPSENWPWLQLFEEEFPRRSPRLRSTPNFGSQTVLSQENSRVMHSQKTKPARTKQSRAKKESTSHSEDKIMKYNTVESSLCDTVAEERMTKDFVFPKPSSEQIKNGGSLSVVVDFSLPDKEFAKLKLAKIKGALPVERTNRAVGNDKSDKATGEHIGMVNGSNTLSESNSEKKIKEDCCYPITKSASSVLACSAQVENNSAKNTEENRTDEVQFLSASVNLECNKQSECTVNDSPSSFKQQQFDLELQREPVTRIAFLRSISPKQQSQEDVGNQTASRCQADIESSRHNNSHVETFSVTAEEQDVQKTCDIERKCRLGPGDCEKHELCDEHEKIFIKSGSDNDERLKGNDESDSRGPQKMNEFSNERNSEHQREKTDGVHETCGATFSFKDDKGIPKSPEQQYNQREFNLSEGKSSPSYTEPSIGEQATPHGKMKEPLESSQLSCMTSPENQSELSPVLMMACLQHHIEGENNQVRSVSLSSYEPSTEKDVTLLKYKRDILAVCLAHLVVIWTAVPGAQWTVLHKWSLPTDGGEEFLSVQIVPLNSHVAVLVGGNFCEGNGRILGYSEEGEYSFNLEHDDKTNICVFSTMCSLHLEKNTNEDVEFVIASQRARELRLTKWTLDSFCLLVEQQQSFLPVITDSDLSSLQAVHGSHCLLLGTTDEELFLWNHKTCQQLRSISLGTMDLGHLSCLKAFTERGLLFLMMSSTSGGEGTDCGEDSNTDACLLFALNPKNSKMICLECFYLEKRLNTVGTNGQYIAAGQQATGKVNIWNITNSQSHATLQVFQDEVNSIGFHQDRPVIAFGSTSGCVHLFSMC